MNTWILPACMTLVCWGTWSFVPKITTRYISPISAMVYETIGAAIMGIVTLAFINFRPEFNTKGMCLGILTGILGIAGALGFLFAVKTGKVSVVAMMASMSPIVTIALAHFLLKEPIHWNEGVGMACAFTAIFFFTYKF